MPQPTALVFFSSHITALRRLTELGLFFAEQMAASTQAPLDGLTEDPMLREAASAGWVPLKSIAAQERGFNRPSSGTSGNIVACNKKWDSLRLSVGDLYKLSDVPMPSK